MSYVLAVLTGFSSSKAGDVVLKARGRAITTAVDVAEITRRRFMTELSVDTIIVGTEELPQEGGGTRAVSTIEITLKRAHPTEKDADEGNVEEKPVSEEITLKRAHPTEKDADEGNVEEKPVSEEITLKRAHPTEKDADEGNVEEKPVSE